VDGTHAFVGGLDLLIELSGDFNRWDSPSQRDVELNFRQRMIICAAIKLGNPWWVTSCLI
jgi:hypothetical protein